MSGLRVVMASATLAVLAACGGCRAGRGGAASVREHEHEAPARAAGADSAVRRAVSLWDANQHEQALQQVMLAAGRPDWRRQLCLYPMTEAQFVRLPESRRDALQKRMLADLDTLRAIARAMAQRAADAQRAGEAEQARRWRTALRRLGEANRGGGVPDLVELVGKAIVRRAGTLEP